MSAPACDRPGGTILP